MNWISKCFWQRSTEKEKTDLYPAIRNLSGARCGANSKRAVKTQELVFKGRVFLGDGKIRDTLEKKYEI